MHLFSLLALGTIWFWIVGIALVMIVTFLVERGRGAAASFCFLGLVFFLYFAARIPLVSWVVEHPVELALWAIAYVFIGLLWGLARWGFFVSECAHDFKDRVDKYKADVGVDPISDKLREFASLSGLNPSARDHETDLLRWMTYWPFSMLYTIINDPITKSIKWLFEESREVFDSISAGLSKKQLDLIEKQCNIETVSRPLK